MYACINAHYLVDQGVCFHYVITTFKATSHTRTPLLRSRLYKNSVRLTTTACQTSNRVCSDLKFNKSTNVCYAVVIRNRNCYLETLRSQASKFKLCVDRFDRRMKHAKTDSERCGCVLKHLLEVIVVRCD